MPHGHRRRSWITGLAATPAARITHLHGRAGLGAGLYRDLEEAAGARPQTERFPPKMDEARRDRAYGRWTDAVGRVRTS